MSAFVLAVYVSQKLECYADDSYPYKFVGHLCSFI